MSLQIDQHLILHLTAIIDSENDDDSDDSTGPAATQRIRFALANWQNHKNRYASCEEPYDDDGDSIGLTQQVMRRPWLEGMLL